MSHLLYLMFRCDGKFGEVEGTKHNPVLFVLEYYFFWCVGAEECEGIGWERTRGGDHPFALSLTPCVWGGPPCTPLVVPLLFFFSQFSSAFFKKKVFVCFFSPIFLISRCWRKWEIGLFQKQKNTESYGAREGEIGAPHAVESCRKWRHVFAWRPYLAWCHPLLPWLSIP